MASPKRTKQKFFPTQQTDTPAKLKVPANDDGTPKTPNLRAQTPGQRPYIRDLRDPSKDIVIATGPAGTGKTYPAVLHAIQQLQAGEIRKIVVTRPMVASGGEELGALPGGIIEKVGPWCVPVLDVFKEFYSVYQVEQMLQREVIELVPLAIMRGRTLKNAIIIGDEMQNSTPGQMKMFLTRIGDNSRMILTGDVEQFDEEQLRRISNTPRGEPVVSGLVDLLDRLEWDGVPDNFGLTGMTERDVVRHKAVGDVLHLYRK